MTSRNIETVKHSADCPYETKRVSPGTGIGAINTGLQTLILACPSAMHDTARKFMGVSL